MKNRKIAEVLKAYRKMNNLSVRDVTELLEEKSLKVAEKTVYGWESSATQPDADTLLLLCDIYNIDNILGTFGYTDEEPINLTKHEHSVLGKAYGFCYDDVNDQSTLLQYNKADALVIDLKW